MAKSTYKFVYRWTSNFCIAGVSVIEGKEKKIVILMICNVNVGYQKPFFEFQTFLNCF